MRLDDHTTALYSSRLVALPALVYANYDANGSPCDELPAPNVGIAYCQVVLVNTPPEYIQLSVSFDGAATRFSLRRELG